MASLQDSNYTAPRLYVAFMGEYDKQVYRVKIDPTCAKNATALIGKKKMELRLSGTLEKMGQDDLRRHLITFPSDLAVSVKTHFLRKCIFLQIAREVNVEPSHMLFIIKGIEQGVKYRIELLPEMLNESIVYFKQKSFKYAKSGIIQGNLGQLKWNQTQEVLQNLGAHLTITYNPEQKTLIANHRLSVVVEPVSPVILSSLPVVIADDNFDNQVQPIQSYLPQLPTLNNSRELVRQLLQYEEKELTRIAEAIVMLFKELKTLAKWEIEEVTPLVKILSPEYCRITLTRLVDELEKHKFGELPLLQSMTEIFTGTQESLYEQAFAESRREVEGILQPARSQLTFSPLTWKEDLKKTQDLIKNKLKAVGSLIKDNPLASLSRTHLEDIAETIRVKLASCDKQDSPLVMVNLSALAAILNVMDTQQISGIPKERHDALCNAIKQYRQDPNLRIAFLAQYSVQELSFVIKNDNTNLQSFLRRSWHMVRGLSIIAGSISLAAPWNALKAIDSIDEFKIAFSFQPRTKEWYLHLRLLQMSFRQHSKAVNLFVVDLLNENNETRSLLDSSNPFFLMGLADLMGERLADPMTAEEDCLSALSLLNHLWDVNGPEGNGFLSSEKKEYREALRQHAMRFIARCSKHKSEQVKRKANEIIAKPGIQVPKEESNSEFPNRLFSNALVKIGFPFVFMKDMAEKLLKDSQFQKEQELFILQDVQTSEGIIKPFDQELNNFKSKENRVLVVEGDAGSGKTMLAKIQAYQRTIQIRCDAPYVLYIPLKRLRDPIHNLRTEGLAYNGISSPEMINRLKERPSIILCDGYDEVAFPNGKENLLKTNREFFEEYPLAKFIFFMRNKCAALDLFHPTNSHAACHVQLTPFNEEHLYRYLDKFLATQRSPWGREEFEHALKIIRNFPIPTTEATVVSNPLLLAVTLIVLPFIVYKLENEQQKSKHSAARQPPNLRVLESIKNKLPNELLLAYTCLSAFREKIRLEEIGGCLISEAEIVTFQYRLAQKLKELNKKPVLQFPFLDSEKELASLLQLTDGLPSAKVSQLLEAGLMGNHNDGWEFRHEAFRLFFLNADLFSNEPGKDRLQEILQHIQHDERYYNFRSYVFR